MPTKDVKKSENSILGARIRQRRRELAVSQISLAKQVGISASYLNLIEWNKRPIAGTLLRNIAEALNLRLQDLDGVTERRLAESLLELAHRPSLASLRIEAERTHELIGRFPGWARAIATLTRSEREAAARAHTLSDRLSNDPYLKQSLHHMLTRIAAIRSSIEIVSDYSDIPTDRRQRFTEIIKEESRILSDIGEALTSYLDKAEDADRILTPIDEVEAFFEARDNHIAALEKATAALAEQLTDPSPITRRSDAQRLCAQHLSDIIDAQITQQSEIKTAAARIRAMRALGDYATDAIMMPMGPFAEQATAARFDLEILAQRFSTDIGSVCRRLTALPPQKDGPTFGNIRANAAGTIIEMRGLPGLAIPRYANACPLWVLYRAQQAPETVMRQRALFPSGARFVFVAFASHTGAAGFGKPRHYTTDMVAMREAHAQQTVYAPDAVTMLENVGPSCRLCPRRNCEHRAEDPFVD